MSSSSRRSTCPAPTCIRSAPYMCSASEAGSYLRLIALFRPHTCAAVPRRATGGKGGNLGRREDHVVEVEPQVLQNAIHAVPIKSRRYRLVAALQIYSWGPSLLKYTVSQERGGGAETSAGGKTISSRSSRRSFRSSKSGSVTGSENTCDSGLRV